jgi:nucleotide-binding universal stress UspA family protein
LRYAHIIGATDFSELGDLATKRAIELAVASKSRLTLLHVLPEPQAPSPLLAHYYDVNITAEHVAEAKAAAQKALAERVPEEAKASGIEIVYEVRMGDPATEILTAEAHGHADLVVISTHGRRGLSRWIMGSVAERVLTHAKADVLAVRPAKKA